MDETRRRRPIVALAALILTLAAAGTASAQPCLIFVHGKQTNTNTFTNWASARSYWQENDGSDDFIRTATREFAASWYVVGYNGTRAYWDPQAAGEVASEIVNATNGGADGGGNRCARTYAEGGTFWVIGHSMGGSVIDFILGNADPDDPNYDLNGPYGVAAQRLTLAITIGGTHRGSQLADNVCGGGNVLCQIAGLVQDCDNSTYWIRSADDVQVRTYSSAPARNVYLTGGYAAIFGPSLCLAGEDDGLVQHASAYACSGSASAGYDNEDVCNDGGKQESSGFHNLDVAHENHDQEREDTDRDDRVAIPTGLWTCGGGGPCPAGTTVQSNLSTAQLVSLLYAVPSSTQLCQAGSASASGRQPCLSCFPGTFAASPGATSCAPCAAGTSAGNTGATSCAPCAAGTYAAASGAPVCLACPANTFSTGSATACSACPPGTSAPAGSSTCTAGTTTTTTLPSNPCRPNNPCLNGATCLASGAATFVCVCPPGVSGSLCEIGGTTTSTTAPTTTSTSSTSTTSSSTSSTTSTTATTSTTSTTLPAACGPTPATGCRLAPPRRSSLKIKDDASGRDQLQWKWGRGETAPEELGDPVHSSSTYWLCLYDGSANAQPLLAAQVAPGTFCGTRTCWKATTTSVLYRNNGDPNGIVKLLVKAGTAGKAKLQTTARGPAFQTPALPLFPPITAQLVVDDGASSRCWQTTFTTTTSNDPFRLSAVGP
jgi:hypothetical protein